MNDDEFQRERALVRTGWELIDLLGQLESARARRLLADRWDAERTRAAETLSPLTTGAKVGGHDLRSYEGPSGQTRFRRTLDYVRPGERVFEIGPGRGYLAGLLLRDAEAAAYYGVDLKADNLAATRELLSLNGLADRAELDTCNLYDLTRARLEEFRTDLLVCCEVIEHVPDPELALKTLAAALPPGTDLLISVPLLGRLEDVWGHLAIFDAARIRDMVEGSGLVVHAVEPIDNIWVFVLASHDAGPSPRAAHASAQITTTLANQDLPTALRPVALDSPGIRPAGRQEGLASHRLESTDRGLVCRLEAARKRWSRPAPATGGIRFPASTPARGLRVEMAVDSLDDVTACYVEAYADGKRVSRWKWDPAVSRPTKSPATFVIRPGKRGHFKRVQSGPLTAVDAIDLVAVVKPGAAVELRITRAAVIV